MIKRIRDFNQKNSLVWKRDTLGEARLIPGAPRVTARRHRIMNMHVMKARYHIKMGYCLFSCAATGGNCPPEGLYVSQNILRISLHTHEYMISYIHTYSNPHRLAPQV